MRVVAGAWRGRALAAPPGQSTRPTADRVRESLFSMLASRIGDFDGLSVADFYAGSGALGIEALSRGAAHCHFIESDRAAAAVVRANLAVLGAEKQAKIAICAVEMLSIEQQFQLIFADPPYGNGTAQAFVSRAAEQGWLAPGGWMAVETGRGDTVEPGGFTLDAARDIGRARVTLLRRA